MLIHKINQLSKYHTCVKCIKKTFNDLVAEGPLMDPIKIPRSIHIRDLVTMLEF